MTLPRLLVLTDRTQIGDRDLVDVVRAVVAGGPCGVVLREKDLPDAARAELVARLRDVVTSAGSVLLVASGAGLGDGVHLSADDPFPSPPSPVVGRSCHHRDEVRRAADEGCTYATLSPIFASASKPGYGPPLGVDALRDQPLPVFALGGVTAARAARCVDAGASGVAVMGEVMRAADPAAEVAALLEAIHVRALR